MLHVVQIQIDDSSNKTITGVYQFDASRGGALILPSGSILPTTGTIAGEIFILTTDNGIYRRNDTNTLWIATSASISLSSSFSTFALTASYVPGGTTDVGHKTLRQLIHLADGGGPFEGFITGVTLETGPQPFPTASIWRTADTKKLVQKSIVRNASQLPTSIQWQVYDVDGITVLATVTDSITYMNNVFEVLRTRAIT